MRLINSVQAAKECSIWNRIILPRRSVKNVPPQDGGEQRRGCLGQQSRSVAASCARIVVDTTTIGGATE